MSTSTLEPQIAAPSGGLRARVRASRWLPLPVVLAGTFMVVLDFFIVNVALPSMQARLHASDGAIEWVVAGYSLTSAVLLVAAGRLGDRYGRRRMFAAGLALFTVASAACGVASGPGMLVIGRLVQGAGAAMLMPNVLSLLGVLYDGEDRARALAAYGMTMGLAAVLGQLIGGLLLQANIAGLGWRTVFLINVPVGCVGLLACERLVPESRAPRSGPIDAAGTALVTVAITAIVLPLVEGRAHGWPLWTWVTLAAAPVVLAVFGLHQRGLARRGESARAILPVELFRAPGFTPGIVAQLAFWMGQASFFLVLALYLQQGRGLSALHSGLVFTMLAASYLAASMLAPRLTERHGRQVLGAGALTLAAGHGLLALAVAEVGLGGSVFALAPGLVLVGAGMGFGIPSLATLIMAGMAPERAGATAGVLATAQNVGTAIGVAVIGVVFFGAAGSGIAGAFQLSVGVLAGVLVVVAALSRLLPAAGASGASASGASASGASVPGPSVSEAEVA
jgi:EmrB/QacA subfamily drug resistance transporter